MSKITSITKEFISKAPSPSPSPSGGEGYNIPPPLRGGDEGEGDRCDFINDRISKWHIGSVILIILALAVAAAAVSAAEMQEIELTDGSVITGEVVSLSGGIFTVRSATLGTLRIEASKIRVIRLPGSAVPGDSRGQVRSLEEKMVGDSEIMNTIRALQNDPDIQKILQDPEIMKAVQTGDFDALMSNPEFMKLLNKQPVQDIKNKLTR